MTRLDPCLDALPDYSVLGIWNFPKNERRSLTVLETTSLHSSDDPGFFALEMLLRLAGLEVDVALLRSISNNGPIDVASILAYARKAELSARCIETRWIDLPKYALPGIIPLRNGSFSIVGSVAGEKVVVLHAGASRPSVLSEAQFTSLWDGRLLLIQRLSPVSASTLRISQAADTESSRSHAGSTRPRRIAPQARSRFWSLHDGRRRSVQSSSKIR